MKRLSLRTLIGRMRMHPESPEWEVIADQLDTHADDENTQLTQRLVRALDMALDARDGWKKAYEEKALTLAKAARKARKKNR